MLVALILILGVTELVQTIDAIRQGPSAWSDYAVDYASARALVDGGDPYALSSDLIEDHLGRAYPLRPDQRNPHTPFQIALLAPLSFLPYNMARVALMLLSACALVIASWLVLTAERRPRWLAFLALGIPFVQYELRYGQVVCLMLLLLVLAVRALDEGTPRTAGMLFGCAAAMKLFPILVVPMLLARKRSDAAAWTIGSTAVLSVVGSLALGWGASMRWVDFSLGGNLDIWAGEVGNISLAGQASRLVGWSSMLSLAGVLIATAGSYRSGESWPAISWSVLGSPIAWIHYGVLTLPRVTVVHPVTAAAGIIGLSFPVVADLPLAWVAPAATIAVLLLAIAPRRGRPFPRTAEDP